MMNATLNIGLLTADKSETLAPTDVMMAVERIAGKGCIFQAAIHTSDSEDTVVMELVRPLPSHNLVWLSHELQQDCVAQFDGRRGELQGPKAADWGPFDPAFFLTIDGQRLAAPALAA